MAPLDRSYDYYCKDSCMLFIYLTLNHLDLEKVTDGDSNCYHSKAYVRFPINLLWLYLASVAR